MFIFYFNYVDSKYLFFHKKMQKIFSHQMNIKHTYPPNKLLIIKDFRICTSGRRTNPKELLFL